jgi:hypothetical protein
VANRNAGRRSRPSGAAVTINGKASGSTPLTINDLAPGEYQILMTMPGIAVCNHRGWLPAKRAPPRP